MDTTMKADIVEALLDHYHNQFIHDGTDYMSTPDYKTVCELMEKEETDLIESVPGLPSDRVRRAVNELSLIAERHLLSAELHGFKKGFQAALLLNMDLERWALKKPSVL